MFVPEVFEMLQDSFQMHHSKFNFPNKELEHSSPKFQSAIGEFTIRLNDKIRTNVMNQLSIVEEKYDASRQGYLTKIDKLQGDKVVLSAFLGLSIALNIAAAIAIF